MAESGWNQDTVTRRGGLPFLAHKLLWLTMGMPAGLVLLVAWILRPVVLIRFGELMSDRIGHYSFDTELYLCSRDDDSYGRWKFDVFCHGSFISNHQLKRMWNRTLHVSQFARWPHSLARRLPGFKVHVIAQHLNRDPQGLLNRFDQHLFLTSEEEFVGRKALQALGVSEGAPFVCIHSRDSDYLGRTYPNKNWNYQDYRDSRIENFLHAAEELVHRGYFAVRTGAGGPAPLNTSTPGIIDYATNGRSEFLDIYLAASCRFYLGDSCGFSGLTMAFRRPAVIVNMVPFEHVPTWGKNDLVIPKKLWLKQERRFMTFREILESGAGRFTRTAQYEDAGIEVVENTSEEITAVAVEMDDRLNGRWHTTEEDEELQRQFWSPFKTSELHGVIVSRIGAEFLRQNRELLT